MADASSWRVEVIGSCQVISMSRWDSLEAITAEQTQSEAVQQLIDKIEKKRFRNYGPLRKDFRCTSIGSSCPSSLPWWIESFLPSITLVTRVIRKLSLTDARISFGQACTTACWILFIRVSCANGKRLSSSNLWDCYSPYQTLNIFGHIFQWVSRKDFPPPMERTWSSWWSIVFPSMPPLGVSSPLYGCFCGKTLLW